MLGQGLEQAPQVPEPLERLRTRLHTKTSQLCMAIEAKTSRYMQPIALGA